MPRALEDTAAPCLVVLVWDEHPQLFTSCWWPRGRNLPAQMQIPGLYPALLQTQLKAFPAPKEKRAAKCKNNISLGWKTLWSILITTC